MIDKRPTLLGMNHRAQLLGMHSPHPIVHSTEVVPLKSQGHHELKALAVRTRPMLKAERQMQARLLDCHHVRIGRVRHARRELDSGLFQVVPQATARTADDKAT